jgi:small GTP-binding protein
MRQAAFKVVFCGNSSVGKTSIIQRCCFNCFTPNMIPTMGADFMPHTLQLPDAQVKLHIWDTAGQEEYQAIGPLFFRSALLAFVVYDVTAESPLEDTKMWIDRMHSIEPGIPIIVFGNKTDLVGSVTMKVGDWCAENGIAHFFCSALSGSGIQDGFIRAAEILGASHPKATRTFAVQTDKRGCCK